MNNITSHRFYNRSRVTNTCKTCSDAKLLTFVSEQFNTQMIYSWFELTKTKYTKTDKKIRPTTGKISKRKNNQNVY